MNTYLKLTWLIACCLISISAVAQDYYIAPNGTDDPLCQAGTLQTPWRSLAVQTTSGCIDAGDTVYFLEGEYDALSDVFFQGAPFSDGTPSGGHIWFINGSAGSPITIAKDPFSSEKWPVKFNGAFTISNSQHVIIDGIEITTDISDAKLGAVLGIGGQHITVKNSLIHGAAGDYNPERILGGDCVKIAGDGTDYIQLISNDIFQCPGDAIDVNGRKHIVYRDNDLYEAWILQIKGGVEDILVENNRIRDMRHGIVGLGMDCTRDTVPGYCGAEELPLLPVQERYNAKNVVIRNNVVENIDHGLAIAPFGFRNTQIYGNKVYNGTHSTTDGTPIVDMKSIPVTIAYFDELADNYCKYENTDSSDCIPCYASGDTSKPSPCWKIRVRAQNIQIYNNYFHGDRHDMVGLSEAAFLPENKSCLTGNEYASALLPNTPEYLRFSWTNAAGVVTNVVHSEAELGLCEFQYRQDLEEQAGWFHTGSLNSLIEKPSAFSTKSIEGNVVLAASRAKDIHSHYTRYSPQADTCEYKGRMKLGNSTAGIGVTFASDFPNTDSYYRLMTWSGQKQFSLSNHPSSQFVTSGTAETQVVPKVGEWYNFHVYWNDTGSATEIKAKVWSVNDFEPGWQIDAVDQDSDRLKGCNVGVWSMGSTMNYWDNLSLSN